MNANENSAINDQIVHKKSSEYIVKLIAKLLIFISVGASVFHLFIAATGILEAFKMRTMHLMFMLPLAFLMFPMKKTGKFSKIGLLDVMLSITTLASLAYLSIFQYDRLIERMQFIDPLYVIDVVISAFLVFAVLEATRRCVGWGMVIIALVAISYSLYGNYIPGQFGHVGTSPLRLLETLSLSTNGIFASTTGASATFIFLFVLFGEFLERSGARQFFIDLAYSITGNKKGGPAKMAVVASCLMGSVSGSSTANVTSTGAYTIPLMKKMGYEPKFAGAVEASASTGGGIMPPVMGAVAFLMAEYVGIPYIKLCAAAAIPAVLYYLTIGLTVHFQATKLGLKGLEEKATPWQVVLKERGYLGMPIIIIIITMVMGFSAYKAALYAILTCLVLSFMKKETRIDFKTLFWILVNGAKKAVLIAITCATAGIVIGIASETGIAVKFASSIINISNGNLVLVLPLVMIASIILGMGLPASAAYIMVAAIAVPALIELNMSVLGSHLFALYFGIFSGITPPVAIAAYAAAGLAGSNPMETGFKAVWISLPAFLLPYAFIFKPALLLEGSINEIIITILVTLVGSIFISMGIVGCVHRKISIIERSVFLLGSICIMISTNWMIIGISFVSMLIVYLRHRILFNRDKDTVIKEQDCVSN